MMNIETILASLRAAASENIHLDQRQPGIYQVIIPVLHEDNDMIDIYVEESPAGKDMVRICDFGLTLMRLSYTYEINSDTRKTIFYSILINNEVKHDGDNLYIDSPVGLLYENILRFAGCVQKISNMRYWGQSAIRSAFFEDLKNCMQEEQFEKFSPHHKAEPLENNAKLKEFLTVDWSLTHKEQRFYLFGINSNDRAKNVDISVLEFRAASLPFLSLVVYEDQNKIGRKEAACLDKNIDIHYPTLEDLRTKCANDIMERAN